MLCANVGLWATKSFVDKNDNKGAFKYYISIFLEIFDPLKVLMLCNMWKVPNIEFDDIEFLSKYFTFTTLKISINFWLDTM